MLILATTGTNDQADAEVESHQTSMAGYPADGGLPWYMFPSPPEPRQAVVLDDQVLPLELDTMGFEFPFGPVAYGVPQSVLEAYWEAVTTAEVTHPGCNLTWQILAGIGKVESDHAWGGNLDEDGTTSDPILGPLLNGEGVAAMADTDNGRYDGDEDWDRAVGPMQFIPSTWETSGADGNGDGVADPNNIYDATAAAAGYLCAGGRDLASAKGLDAALFSYNHSESYVQLVRSWISAYETDGGPVPDSPAVPPFAYVAAESGSESGSAGRDKDDSKRRSPAQEKEDGSGSHRQHDPDEGSPPPEQDEPEPSPVPSLPLPEAPEAPEPGVLPKLSTPDAGGTTDSVGDEDYIFRMTEDTTETVESPG